MHFCFLFALAVLAYPVWAQPAPAQLPPDTVVARMGDITITVADLAAYSRAGGQQAQRNMTGDPKAFLQQLVLMRLLAREAEQAKLHEQSPYTEQLALNRQMVLSQARLSDHYDKILITAEDQRNHYEKNRDQYRQMRVKVIYLSFTSNPAAIPAGQKVRNETESLELAKNVLAKARAGEDFGKLAGEHSDDMKSKHNNGEFGVIRRTDKIPEEFARAIFALKPGDVTEPLRQPNGYYLFRAEEEATQPFDEVRDEIYSKLKETRQRAWLDELSRKTAVEIEKPEFFERLRANPAASATPNAR